MALTDPSTVIELGSLQPGLFEGVEDDDDLQALVGRWIEINSAWLGLKLGATYETTDARTIKVLKAGETYLVLSDLHAQLGARKVFGTNAPIDSEESSSYFDGMASFYRQRAMEFLDQFLILDTPGKSFARPYFAVSSDVDSTTLQAWTDELTDVLDDARGVSVQEVTVISP